MNYSKAEHIISKMEKKGSIYGLECMCELMRRLGSPQDSLKFIHVTGTNGKGSVIALLSGALSKSGYLVGRFTSPAVFSRRETISTNLANISEQEYAELVNKILIIAEEMTSDGMRAPTAFEIETAVAFLYFEMKKCDIVLLEVGLGGDLDATNIIKAPICSVIMPISIDHVNILGDTLEEIAIHKSGIIKKGSFVVSAKQKPEVQNVLQAKAEKCDCEIIYPQDYIIIDNGKNIKKYSDFLQKFIYNRNDMFEITLRGKCQIGNAAVALEVLKILKYCGFNLSAASINEGFKSVEWKGRFTVIHTAPDIIIDGAHNEGAASVLADNVVEYKQDYNIKNIIMVAGMLSDKDYDKVISTVAVHAATLITINTKVTNRQLDGNVLKDIANKYGITAYSTDSVVNAVDIAFEHLGRKDLLLAFGSFSFLAEFEDAVNQKYNK